jgi:PAS domain S-box-containing protein
LPSKTSETLLIRQVQDSVEFITELRHIENKPHSLKISLNDKEVPAVQAVLGYKGIWEGLDYRGEEVIADIKPITNTKWFMIAKVDKDEILSELYSSYVYIILFSFFIILFISALAAFIYAYRKSTMYKALWETEEEFKTTLYSIGDAVITTDREGNVKYLNQIAQNLTGWNEREAKGKKLSDIFKIINEDTRTPVDSPINNVLENGSIEALSSKTLLISKTGTEIPIADSGAPIKNNEGEILGVVLVFRDMTKEIEQNAKIIESEKRFRSLFHSIRDAILVSDTERNIIDCNEAFTDIFGYSLEEIKGKKTLSVYQNEEQYKELGKALKEYYGIKTFNYTVNYRRKDGSVFPGETGVFYLKDKDEKVIGFIGLIRDVTERKRAEEELFHQKNLMQYVIEHANSAVAVHDRDLRYIYVSNVYLQQYGIEDENILGKHHYEVFPDLPQKWRDVHQKVLKGEVHSSDKDPYERENGKIDWTRWECRPWYENDGSIGGLIVYTEVITDRVEEEQKLIQSEKRFKSIVEGAPDPIFIQTDMKFAYLNPAACKLFGIIDSGELIGKPVMERFHPDYYEKIKNRISRLNNMKKPVEELLEQKFIRVDGSEVWVETAGEPINYEGENGALVFVRDITERKEAENVLENLKNNLEIEVKQKTKELQERVNELERFHKATIDRELRMKELRDEIKRLKGEM